MDGWEWDERGSLSAVAARIDNVTDAHTHTHTLTVLSYFVLLAKESRRRKLQCQSDWWKAAAAAAAAGSGWSCGWNTDVYQSSSGFYQPRKWLMSESLSLRCVWEGVCWRHTEVHVDSTRPLGVGHVLVNSVQDLLLHLCDGVTVQHLDWNLWTVFVVRIDAV